VITLLCMQCHIEFTCDRQDHPLKDKKTGIMHTCSNSKLCICPYCFLSSEYDTEYDLINRYNKDITLYIKYRCWTSFNIKSLNDYLIGKIAHDL